MERPEHVVLEVLGVAESVRESGSASLADGRGKGIESPRILRAHLSFIVVQDHGGKVDERSALFVIGEA